MESLCSRNRKTLLLAALLLAGIFSFLAPSIHAAGPIPVAITPTRIEFAASAGERLTGTVEFWNGTDDQLPVHLETDDLAVQGEEGHAVVGGEEDPTNSLKAWVTLAIPDLVVFPKQKIKLDFTIDIPANADPGSHWGALLVRTAPVSSAGGAAVQVRVGTILLVDVYGEAKEKLVLESFSVPRFLEEPPVTLVARFRNYGTVHEKPAGTIEVRNMFGQPAKPTNSAISAAAPATLARTNNFRFCRIGFLKTLQLACALQFRSLIPLANWPPEYSQPKAAEFSNYWFAQLRVVQHTLCSAGHARHTLPSTRIVAAHEWRYPLAVRFQILNAVLTAPRGHSWPPLVSNLLGESASEETI